MVLTLPQQRLHHSPRLLPIPPTYELNGSSFGRPDVDLMFAKWAFNHVTGEGAWWSKDDVNLRGSTQKKYSQKSILLFTNKLLTVVA